MAVLVVLARAGGATVTREELVRACWQGRIVSDDAISRTIAKVRMLARSATPTPFTLETLSKVGYRLMEAERVTSVTAVAADEPLKPPGRLEDETARTPARPSRQMKLTWRSAALMAVTAVAIPLMWGVLSAGSKLASTGPSNAWDGGDNLRAWQVADALFALDEKRLRSYFQQGWNPNWLLDSEGNTPLHTLMLVCERNPTHDQAGVEKVARFLVATGSDPSIKNKWGDTPLIIAQAPKYCGPDHPVVAFLQAM